MSRRSYGERSICKRCDLEIEFIGGRNWHDRGGNTTCAKSGFKHLPNSRNGELLGEAK